MQLRRIVWRWRKLFQDFSSYACRRLLHSDDRGIAKITLHEENHLFITHKDIVSTHVVQPSLYRILDSCFVFFSNSGQYLRISSSVKIELGA